MTITIANPARVHPRYNNKQRQQNLLWCLSHAEGNAERERVGIESDFGGAQNRGATILRHTRVRRSSRPAS